MAALCCAAQELEKGIDTMLHAYGGDMDMDELEGPSPPAPAAGKKKAARPSRKARATSNRGAHRRLAPVWLHFDCRAVKM